jgi:hypothetical protein
MAQVAPLRECVSMVVVSTAPLHSSRCLPPLLFSVVFVPFLNSFTVTACFRVAGILFQVATTHREKKFLLVFLWPQCLR